MKQCTSCCEWKDFEKFSKSKGHLHGLSSLCRDCRRTLRRTPKVRAQEKAAKRIWDQKNKDHIVKRDRDFRRAHPERGMLRGARLRARMSGVSFSITFEDILKVIPTDGRCPITQQEFVRTTGKVGANSMSLDRIVPSKGYVPGNIVVISHWANRMKQNCTDPEIFVRLAAYVRNRQCP